MGGNWGMGDLVRWGLGSVLLCRAHRENPHSGIVRKPGERRAVGRAEEVTGTGFLLTSSHQ